MTLVSHKLTSILCILATLFFTIQSSILSAPSSVNSDDTVIETCKKTRFYDLCMTILFPDPRCHGADAKFLAKIVMQKDLYISNQILSEAQKLAHDPHQPGDVRKKCGKCAEEYKLIVSTLLPGANKSVESGEYAAAIKELNSVASCAKICDDQSSPIVNMSVHDISLVAIDILKTIT